MFLNGCDTESNNKLNKIIMSSAKDLLDNAMKVTSITFRLWKLEILKIYTGEGLDAENDSLLDSFMDSVKILI